MAKVTRDDWATAALFKLAEGGVSAVRVEPMARELGVTKGSFYWHFKNRSDLVQAALELWYQRGTVHVIAQLASVERPEDQLSALFAESVANLQHLRAEAALMAAANAGHPVIAPVVKRVSSERLAFLQALFGAMGTEHPQSAGLVAYAAYLGAVQLAAMRPSPLESPEGSDLVAALQRAFVAPNS